MQRRPRKHILGVAQILDSLYSHAHGSESAQHCVVRFSPNRFGVLLCRRPHLAAPLGIVLTHGAQMLLVISGVSRKLACTVGVRSPCCRNPLSKFMVLPHSYHARHTTRRTETHNILALARSNDPNLPTRASWRRRAITGDNDGGAGFGHIWYRRPQDCLQRYDHG